VLQLLFSLADQRPVELAALGQADGAQRLDQVVLLEFMLAGEIDRADRGTLEDLNDHHVAFSGDLHVVEEACRVARMAPDAFSSVNASPCVMGRQENTVPGSTRLSPSIRMSLTTNGAVA